MLSDEKWAYSTREIKKHTQLKHIFNIIPQLKITDINLQNMLRKRLLNPLFGSQETPNIFGQKQQNAQ